MWAGAVAGAWLTVRAESPVCHLTLRVISIKFYKLDWNTVMLSIELIGVDIALT